MPSCLLSDSSRRFSFSASCESFSSRPSLSAAGSSRRATRTSDPRNSWSSRQKKPSFCVGSGVVSLRLRRSLTIGTGRSKSPAPRCCTMPETLRIEMCRCVRIRWSAMANLFSAPSFA
eukprot:3105550-Prymnesium_polylepis.1